MNISELAQQDPPRKDQSSADWLQETFARHQAQLLGTLFYLLGNREDAHDALQEAFIKCWRHREKISHIENLKAWIFQVVLNTGRDLRQTAWRRRRMPLCERETMLLSSKCEPDAGLQREEQLEQVRKAIAQLRTEEQEVFLLRQNGELTYDQIAETIGIPVGTVKTRMRLSLAKLRTLLESAEPALE